MGELRNPWRGDPSGVVLDMKMRVASCGGCQYRLIFSAVNDSPPIGWGWVETPSKFEGVFPHLRNARDRSIFCPVCLGKKNADAVVIRDGIIEQWQKVTGFKTTIEFEVDRAKKASPLLKFFDVYELELLRQYRERTKHFQPARVGTEKDSEGIARELGIL